MRARRPVPARPLARAGAFATRLMILGGLVSCAASQPAGGPGALVGFGDRFSECESGQSARDWAAKRTEVVEFGLGYLRLRAGAASATFTGAALHGVTGSLVLEHVALVPGGAFGEGFAWGTRKPIQFPAAWQARVTPPGGILRARNPSGVKGYPNGWDGRTWQLVVAVRSGGGDGGVAAGVTIRYTSGGAARTLVQRDPVGVTRSATACDDILTPLQTTSAS